jgi:guanylate kinase
MGKVIILSAPSGAGKTTLAKRLMANPEFKLKFSVSATTRGPRPGEIDGKDYYFLTLKDFKRKIEEDAFVEWEEVYPGIFYGTLKSEIERIFNEGYNILFDVDVKGGLNLKKYFGDKALSIFVSPPSFNELKRRLEARGTETPQSLQKRLTRAKEELTYIDKFDTIIINDDIEKAKKEIAEKVNTFLNS